MGITFSYISLWEIFLASEWRRAQHCWEIMFNDYIQCASLVYLTRILFLPVKMQNWMCFLKVVIKISNRPTPTYVPPPPPTDPRCPLVDIFPWHIYVIVYEWETYFYNNFYETHSILHFNRKWEREFKSDIPDSRIDCIHLTIISHQCFVLVILVQEIFPKEIGN